MAKLSLRELDALTSVIIDKINEKRKRELESKEEIHKQFHSLIEEYEELNTEVHEAYKKHKQAVNKARKWLDDNKDVLNNFTETNGVTIFQHHQNSVTSLELKNELPWHHKEQIINQLIINNISSKIDMNELINDFVNKFN
jgi:sugar-specific transcriptional regulator TrmB